MKREIILNNLDCANCAQKIENQVKKIEEIEASNLNFVAKKLVIEVKDLSKIDIIEDKIKNIVKKTEPDVEVIFEGKKTKMKKPYKNRKEEIILGVSIILYFVAFLLKLNEVLQIVLFTITYLLVGYEVLLKSFRNILKGEIFDENFLMSVATIGAFAIKQYPEAAAVMLFYQIGEYIQGLAVKKSRKSIASLMDIRPDYANLKQGILIKKVSPKDVKIDDLIIVKPGEKIPLDGIVVDGKSMVDSSALTGESKLKQLKIGDDALSGFINKNGVLTIKVTKNFGESTVSKILDLVEHASSKKAKTENFITKFAKIYTPVVVFIAVGLAIIPPFILQIGVFQDWFYRALIFLVISCPCALVISIPLGFFGGIGAASKHGILVKGSNYLESLNQVEIVVFDKTGTLTKGTFKVNKIEAKNKFKEDELLEYVAYAENYSNHPIAKSILEAYEKNVDRTKIEDHEEIEGYG
ncbi:MAG: heavy metal translocating P-type ATPase, partial [Clostridiaceae bacterium]